MATWKATERRIAQRLNGDRVPVADKRSTTDVISDHLCVEVKHRKTLPSWLHGAMNAAHSDMEYLRSMRPDDYERIFDNENNVR